MGAILGASVPLVQALEEGWQWAVLAAAAAALALGRAAFWALVGGAIAGLVAMLAGASIP